MNAKNNDCMTISSIVTKVSNASLCPKTISKPPKAKIKGDLKRKRGFSQALSSFEHEVRHFAWAISDPEKIASKEH